MTKFIENILFGLAFGIGWALVNFFVWLILFVLSHIKN